MRTCNLCQQEMQLNFRDVEDDRQAECELPMAQWVCFCNSGNYAAIEHGDFPGEDFYIQPKTPFDDLIYQSVFPSPLAEFSQNHTTVEDAISYFQQVIGEHIQPVILPI